MTYSVWLSAAAALVMTGSIVPALGQTASTPPTTSPDAWSAQSAPPRPAPAPKQPSGAHKQRSTQPTPPRAGPNASYAYCRGVARYMRLRGVERRKTILDCQLGVMPRVTKG